MNIEVGKFYKTRNDLKVRIYASDGAEPYSFHGAVFMENVWQIRQWACNGEYYSEGPESANDLVSEWRDPVEVKGWINVYNHDYAARIRPTRAAADRADLGGSRIACVYVSGVEGKEP